MAEKDHGKKTEKACDADQEQPIRSSDGFVGEWVLWIGFFFFLGLSVVVGLAVAVV